MSTLGVQCATGNTFFCKKANGIWFVVSIVEIMKKGFPRRRSAVDKTGLARHFWRDILFYFTDVKKQRCWIVGGELRWQQHFYAGCGDGVEEER